MNKKYIFLTISIILLIILSSSRYVITGYGQEPNIDGYGGIEEYHGYDVACISIIYSFFCQDPMPKKRFYIIERKYFPIWSVLSNETELHYEKGLIKKDFYCYDEKRKRINIPNKKTGGVACSKEYANIFNEIE